MAAPTRCFRSRINSRICAWIVTSSAVVGSSAISSFGLQASAMAIITRWRMPPESWCGYSRTRRRASGMPTRFSISTARSSASFAERPWWRRSVSPICRPTVSTGFRLVIGSWKIMEMSLPRIARISRSEHSSRFFPFSRIAPAILPGGSGISRRMDMAVTDLPQPDSPTMASVSPAFTWKETPSTARLMPSGVRKWVWRFSTSSRGMGLTASWPCADRARRADRHRGGSPPAP